MFIFPHHLFVPMQGKRPDPWQKGRQLLCIPDWDPPWQTPLGSQPIEGLGFWLPWGCCLLFHLGTPNVCRTFHPRLTFLSLVFSFFLPLSLLAVTLSPLRCLRPDRASLETWGLSLSCPLGNASSLWVCAFQRWKGAECCPEWQQVTKNFQKKWAKPFPFLYWGLLSLPRPRHTGPHSARSGRLSKSKWREAQLISVHSLKFQVKGGRGRNNEVFN